jgi:hypothetical protein
MTTSATQNFSLNHNSSTGGVAIVTIPSPAADVTYGTSTPCRKCWVSMNTGSHDFYIDFTTATTSTSFKVVYTSSPIEIPIDDLNKLHFIGTATETISIMYVN